MGTPKSSLTVSVAQHLEFLSLAKALGRSHSDSALEELFAGLADFLAPLVEWLDQPIPSDRWKRRGLELFVSASSTFDFKLFLQRSGTWLVWDSSMDKKDKFEEVGSQGLSRLVKKNLWEMIPRDIFPGLLAPGGGVRSEFLFLQNLIEKRALIWFLTECQSKIKGTISERQKRLRQMEERAGVFHVFCQALDSLLVTGSQVEIPLYDLRAITGNNKGDVACLAREYLHPSAIKGLEELAVANYQGCEEVSIAVGESGCVVTSLGELFSELGMICSHLQSVPNLEDALRDPSRRLPLTEEEWRVIGGIADRIEKGR